MRLVFKTLTLTLLLFAGHTAWATPQEDAALMAQRTVATEIGEAAIGLRLKELQVRNYTEQLNAHRVSVIDPDRFADMLPAPDTGSNAWRIREKLAKRYIGILSEEELAEIAERMRVDERVTVRQLMQEKIGAIIAEELSARHPSSGPSNSDEHPLFQQQEPAFQMLSVGGLAWHPGYKKASQIQGLSIFAAGWTKLDNPDVDLPLADPVVIQILETEGILSASNRIIINDLVKKLRNSIESARETQRPGSGGIQFNKPPGRG